MSADYGGLHQWHLERGDEPRARAWCESIMCDYGFRTDMRHHVLATSVFGVGNWGSTRGGGHVHFGYEGTPNAVWMDTAQTEAALHELTHAAWKEVERLYGQGLKDKLVRLLLDVYRNQADRIPWPEQYRTVRELCRVYKYGEGNFVGMGDNHDEVVAGLASGVMADMSKIPPAFKPIFARIFRWPQELPHKVWLPHAQAVVVQLP